MEENGEIAERIRESKRRWKQEHPDKLIAQIVKRTRERCQQDPIFKFEQMARRCVRSAINLNKNGFSSKRVFDVTGLGKEELRNYLLNTFYQTYGYEWDGIEPTNIDHIIPLCTGKTLEDSKRLFDYHNLRLIRYSDNHAKGTSLDYQIGAC